MATTTMILTNRNWLMQGRVDAQADGGFTAYAHAIGNEHVKGTDRWFTTQDEAVAWLLVVLGMLPKAEALREHLAMNERLNEMKG
jgi:hypothetical protein